MVAEWQRRATIYALPARYEPFGLSILEASIAGCALVLGDIDSLREIWGDAALFVPVDDAPALTAAIQSLVDHPDRRAGLAARAQRRAARYSMASMAAQYRTLYDELAHSRCKPVSRSISA
jgi:glycosyltransferase involved in cell wall biosynthesis